MTSHVNAKPSDFTVGFNQNFDDPENPKFIINISIQADGLLPDKSTLFMLTNDGLHSEDVYFELTEPYEVSDVLGVPIHNQVIFAREKDGILSDQVTCEAILLPPEERITFDNGIIGKMMR